MNIRILQAYMATCRHFNIPATRDGLMGFAAWVKNGVAVVKSLAVNELLSNGGLTNDY